MIKEYKVKISEELRDYIQKLHYEKEARISLLLHMLSNDKFTKEKFDKIHDEYLDFFIQCEIAKNELQDIFIGQFTNGKKVPWNLIFSDCEVIIYGEKN